MLLSLCLSVLKYYLTQSINTDVGAVLRAQRPILNFAGQGKEEIITFSKAVQFAYILIWKKRKEPQEPEAPRKCFSTMACSVTLLFFHICVSKMVAKRIRRLSHHPLLYMVSRCRTILWTVCCCVRHTAVLCSRWCWGGSLQCYRACTTWRSPHRTSLHMQACEEEHVSWKPSFSFVLVDFNRKCQIPVFAILWFPMWCTEWAVW